MKIGGCRDVAGLSLLAIVAALCSVSPAAQAVTLDVVLARAALYVNEFVGRFSNVVTEERYVQDVSGLSQLRNASERHRELTSDFLLVRTSDSSLWLPFRDVFEVSGAPVRDREERLAKLFLESPAAALNRARQLADEGARYNLGTKYLYRTVNNPLMTLVFLQEENQPRFRYEFGGREPRLGTGVHVVEFREQERPTFIRGAFDADLPARGRFWIDVETGRIAQAELLLIEAFVHATLTTVFQRDDRLGIDAPAEMREAYRLNNGGTLTGRATYGRFRRFGVTTEEKLDNPR